jgi:imidazolonepropionase-like amidohydrolase
MNSLPRYIHIMTKNGLNNSIHSLIRSFLLLAFFGTATWAQSSEKAYIIDADSIHIGTGQVLYNGRILVDGGIIRAVGSQSEIEVPSEATRLEAQVVTPGFIDAHTVVGLAGYLNDPGSDQDQLDRSSAIQPELRALDAYNPAEPLVAHLRSNGVTTIQAGHAPGALVSGQSLIIKTNAEQAQQALVSQSMLTFSLGGVISGAFSKPGTRAKSMAMIRQELIKAQGYAKKRAEGGLSSTDLGMEALADLLDGRTQALVSVHRAQDILTAIRLQKEFGFQMVLDGVAEIYLVLDQVKESGVPVILHPTMLRATGEAVNVSMETAALLAEEGIPFAFQSGYENYVPKTRVVLFEAGVAVNNGLNPRLAVQHLSLYAAQLLGIDHRVGSLEVGKDADLVLFNGDPFEYTTTVNHVMIDGQLMK